MDIANVHDIFVNSNASTFRRKVPSRQTSRSSSTPRQRGEDRLSRQPIDHVTPDTHADFQTLKRVLDVLKEGKMDVAGFLDALCWGNQMAVVDPVAKAARTKLTHSDQLAKVVSRWLHPPRTSQGGPTAEGARHTLFPLMLKTVKEVINEEMDLVVEELKEESADVTEQSVLGTVIEEIQETVRVTAPVFYDLVKTAAWSERQEERNKLKDPTKVRSDRKDWLQ